MRVDVCLYHRNCVDGITAAWAVWRKHPDAVFQAVQYGDPFDPQTYAEKNVVIVDFSFQRPVMEHLVEVARSVLVLDHHKTAKADLQVLLPHISEEAQRRRWHGAGSGPRGLFGVFDMDRSGAELAWDWFHPTVARRPKIVAYAADRDLWKHELPHTREISAALAAQDKTLLNWDVIARQMDGNSSFDLLRLEGRAALAARKAIEDECIKGSLRLIRVLGNAVPLVNCPGSLASDIGNRLARNHPFAVMYSDGPEGRKVSLRSVGNFDVAEIARQYGGGGHQNAAGFLAPHGWDGQRPDPNFDPSIAKVLAERALRA